jgi:hypothetical protein
MYIGQFFSSMPSASRHWRKLTESRSTIVRSFKSRITLRQVVSELTSACNSGTFSEVIRPLSFNTTSPFVDLVIFSIFPSSEKRNLSPGGQDDFGHSHSDTFHSFFIAHEFHLPELSLLDDLEFVHTLYKGNYSARRKLLKLHRLSNFGLASARQLAKRCTNPPHPHMMRRVCLFLTILPISACDPTNIFHKCRALNCFRAIVDSFRHVVHRDAGCANHSPQLIYGRLAMKVQNCDSRVDTVCAVSLMEVAHPASLTIGARSNPMSTENATPVSICKRYGADYACRHCDGVIRHEPCRLSHTSSVQYAYHAISDADSLSHGDHLILHTLGARWDAERTMPARVTATERTDNIASSLVLSLSGVIVTRVLLYQLSLNYFTYRS